MGANNNKKYSRKEIKKIVEDIGFVEDRVNGKTKGKGDHVVMSHSLCPGYQINVPVRSDLPENEMNRICALVAIVIDALGLDKSRFKSKEGVEGKIRNSLKQLIKNPAVLFDRHTRNVLNLQDDNEVIEYIEKTKANIRKKKQ